jgi:hypothetical protein
MQIRTANVNTALPDVMFYLKAAGVTETSRNGPVLVAPEPVLVTYLHPRERVLFNPRRDANPFFHLFEALWMLGGRDDIAFLEQYNSTIGQFSDDGRTLHGAYGMRWRSWFGYDQLNLLVDELRANPNSRRAVLSMWNATAPNDTDSDLHVARAGGLDVPCNTHAYLDCRGGKLNLTVCNRSNDAVWGMLGANYVHMTILMEYLAAWVDVPMGVYRQFTNNLHVYTERHDPSQLLGAYDYYMDGDELPYPLVQSAVIGNWDYDLRLFLENPTHDNSYSDPFFSEVAHPLAVAWKAHKEGRHDAARAMVRNCQATDWRTACAEWLERRYAAQ